MLNPYFWIIIIHIKKLSKKSQKILPSTQKIALIIIILIISFYITNNTYLKINELILEIGKYTKFL